MSQLRLDGTASAPTAGARQAPFTPAQKEIIARLRAHGVIAALEAGEIVHRHRSPPCRRCTDPVYGGRCPYRSSDGSDALKRLLKRGLVQRRPGGGWELATE